MTKNGSARAAIASFDCLNVWLYKLLTFPRATKSNSISIRFSVLENHTVFIPVSLLQRLAGHPVQLS